MESLKVMHNRDVRRHLVLLLTAFYLLLSVASLTAGERNILSAPARYPDVIQKVKQLTEKGNNREALELLSPFISEPAKYPVAVSDYISILVWESRFSEAITLYEGLPHSFLKRPYLSRNAAKAYYEMKEFQKAFFIYKDLLEQIPLDEEVHKGVVYSLMQSGDYDSADDYLRKFLMTSSDPLSLYLIKIQILMYQKKYNEILSVYRVLLDRNDIDKEYIYKLREDMMADLSAEMRGEMINALSSSVEAGEKEALPDYILANIISRKYEPAIKVFESPDTKSDEFTDNMMSWIAWAYFKTGNIVKAKKIYQQILTAVPGYARANVGLSYCLAEEGQAGKAHEILDRLQSAQPQNTEIMYARAFVYEKSQRFWPAIREYENILKISRNNPTAGRLMFKALSDLGASSQVLEEVDNKMLHEPVLREKILGDMAVDRIKWKEYRMAINILLPLAEDDMNLRARYDYIKALIEDEDMKEAVQAYEDLIKDGVSVPAWLLEDIAGAYLYLERPLDALKLYDESLRINPSSYDGRMGRFYTLQELREWGEAGKTLEDLDRDTPEVIKSDTKIDPNWPKLDIMFARGWFLLYEERYKDAEEYFRGLHEMAPANAGFRAGLAHTYLWRGWPRKALTEFRIAETPDPKDVGIQTGKIATLNTLAFREEARKEAQDLLGLHPKAKRVLDLVRRFKVEDMRQFVTDFEVSSDDDGFAGTHLETRLSIPVSPYTRMFGFLLWEKSEDKENVNVFRRTGIGVDHVFNSSWHVLQQFSANYNNGKDVGSLTRIGFTPDDYWAFDLSYDSFTKDVPLRARIFGIDADKLDADITYRESERRSYRLSLSQMQFSDDNKRYQGLFEYEQELLVRNDWKMKLFLDLFTSSNSLEDTPYFNPHSDLSIGATHMTEYTLFRMYNKSFVHRLYLSLGAYRQSGFSTYGTGSLRYEHEINFSDVHSLLYGADVSRRVFDGDAVTGYGFNVTWRRLF